MITGSLQNKLYANTISPAPEVGMGATRIWYTDRDPYTVIEVLSARKIVVQADTAERIDSRGLSEWQTYAITSNPNGEKLVLTKRKDDSWQVFKSERGGSVFLLGQRTKYQDPSY